MSMLKRMIAGIMTFIVLLCFTIESEAAGNNRIIYWYICGTDIETTRIQFNNATDLMSDKLGLYSPDKYPGDATRCIKEAENARLSSNLKIFMQAGGTYVWGHEKFRDLNAKMDTKATVYNKIAVKDDEGKYVKDENGNYVYKYEPIKGNILTRRGINVQYWTLSKDDPRIKPVKNGKIGRYLYDQRHGKWNTLEQINISGKKNTVTDMGSKAGLVSFLKAGQELEKKLYPDGNVRRVLIFVDHGAGIGGVCFDEYTRNLISLNELREAFNEVKDGWGTAEKKTF